MSARTWMVVALAPLVWPARSVAVPPDGTASEEKPPVRELVEQLGAPAFRARERAVELLAQRGDDARRSLQQAVYRKDAEVVLQARRLLRFLEVEKLWLPSVCGALDSKGLGVRDRGSGVGGDASGAQQAEGSGQQAEGRGERSNWEPRREAVRAADEAAKARRDDTRPPPDSPPCQAADPPPDQVADPLTRRLADSLTRSLADPPSAPPADAPARPLASKLLQQIAQQTGNRILLGDSFGSFHDAPVEAPAGERVAFWDAVDAVCRQSGNYVRPSYQQEGGGLVVVAGEAGQYPLSYAGPLRAAITSVRRAFVEETEFQSGHVRVTHTFDLSFQVLWEDRLQLVAYDNSAQLVRAVTDCGDELSATPAAQGGWSVVSPARRQLTFALRLDPPSWNARKLDDLRVQVELLAVGDFRDGVLEDLESSRPRQFEGLTATIEKMQPKGPGWEITLLLAPETAVPEPPEALFHENRFEARDAEGRPLRLHERSHWLTDQGVRFALLFAGEQQNPPKSLLVRYPRIRSQRPIELCWRDVPLPAKHAE